MAAMGPTARVSHVLCARTCRFLSGRTASSSSSPVSPFRGARAAAAAAPKIGRRGWQWRAVRARLDVAVRPDTYREELDVKIERARSHFAAAPAPAVAPIAATPASGPATVAGADLSSGAEAPRRRERAAAQPSTVSAVFDSIFGGASDAPAAIDAPASPTPSSGSDASGTGPKTFRRPR